MFYFFTKPLLLSLKIIIKNIFGKSYVIVS